MFCLESARDRFNKSTSRFWPAVLDLSSNLSVQGQRKMYIPYGEIVAKLSLDNDVISSHMSFQK